MTVRLSLSQDVVATEIMNDILTNSLSKIILKIDVDDMKE